jgi:hypothetical protein
MDINEIPVGDPQLSRKSFDVRLSSLAEVTTTVTVEAEDEEDARNQAFAQARGGNVEWKYNGVIDAPDALDVTSVIPEED